MSSTPASPERPATSQRAHVLLYAIFCLLLIGLLVVRHRRPLVLGDAIAVEPGQVAQVEQRIDPNTATWEELARLPGVGESLGRRIVAYREEALRHRPAPVFRRLDDLDPVKGIGPKILERIGPGLKFPQPARR